MKQYYAVFHMDHLDRYPLLNSDAFREAIKALYVEGRNGVCEILNSKIETINKLYNETGKPTSFGRYVEDINPEYTKFINTMLQPELNDFNYKFNQKYHCSMMFYLDEICDVRARIMFLPGVDIWITLKEM